MAKLSKSTVRKLVMLALLVGLMIFAYFEFATPGSFKNSLEAMAKWPAGLVFLAIALLPIFGFSVSIVYIVAGLKFGPWWGLLVVSIAIAIHLLGSHWVAQSFLKERILNYLKRKNIKVPKIPEGENAAATLMIALVPGLPYVVRNYLLPLAGIPLKQYFWICWPIYLIRSVIGIFFGDLSLNMSSGKLWFLAGFITLKILICAYLIRRLRHRFKDQGGVFAKA